jgi:hypothetical protein
MILGSLGRLSYALGLLLAPDAMGKRRLAPSSDDAYVRMTARAFGAVHTNVSLLSLRAAILNRDTRLVLGLNIGCDVGDLLATFLEWRDDDLPAAAAVGSLIVQSAGIATWSLALRSLSE